MAEEEAKKQLSLKKKDEGNTFYKNKEFEKAISAYDSAIALDGTNIVFYNNKAAVLFEQANFDQVVEVCTKGIEIGREARADYTQIAKAYARMGRAYRKKEDYENAVTFLNKSLSEHRDKAVLTEVGEVKKLLAEQQKKAYINPELAEQEKALGNEAWKSGKYPDAVKHYTEAIKRNPEDPKILSNRAAAYTKLMEFNLALKDAEEAIKIDPKFVKAYLRKATCHKAMKETDKARNAYEEALKHDEKCSEAREGLRQCMMESYSNPEDARKRAMNDPEIQKILADPGMRMILEQMSQNPAAAQEHLKNPEIMEKIGKLMEAGVIGMK